MTFWRSETDSGQWAVHTNRRPADTIGLAWPAPTKRDFHRTFSCSGPPHLVGKVFSGVEPSPVGPRNCGQSSPRAAAANNTAMQVRLVRIGFSARLAPSLFISEPFSPTLRAVA